MDRLLAANLAPPAGYGRLAEITLASLVAGLIKLLLLIAFVAALVFLLVGGLRWIFSGGDKAALESARGTVVAALIGLLVVLFAWGLMTLLESIFAVPIISGSFPLPRFFP